VVQGDNIDTIKKNTKTLIDASKEVGLEINVENTKYIFFFVNHVYLQSVQVHLANEVIKKLVEECPAAHLHYI
jgi:hypothetical protein